MKRVRKKNTNLVKQIIEEHTKPAKPKPQVEFLSTGCDLFDLVLSGGFPVGRMVNLIGDKSSGKSLLALEFIANVVKNTNAKIVYDDVEIGINFDTETMFNFDLSPYKISSTSIEDFSCNIAKAIKDTKKNEKLIYIVDSFDALTSEAEISRMDERIKNHEEGKNKKVGTYGMEKQKYSSEFFRSFIRNIAEANCILIIISQVRDNLQPFGKKHVRVGGRALDFYATQTIWLYEIEKIFKTDKLKKAGFHSGIRTLIEVTKNKVGKAFRKAPVTILNDYGVDNLGSNIQFLKPEMKGKALEKYIEDLGGADMPKDEKEIKQLVLEAWQEMEDKAKITRKAKF